MNDSSHAQLWKGKVTRASKLTHADSDGSAGGSGNPKLQA